MVTIPLNDGGFSNLGAAGPGASGDSHALRLGLGATGARRRRFTDSLDGVSWFRLALCAVLGLLVELLRVALCGV